MKFFRNRSCLLRTGKILLAALILLIFFAGYLFYINRPVQVELPERKLPENNSYHDVMAILERLTDNKPVGPISDARPDEEWTFDELKVFHSANSSDLDALEAALKGRPFVLPRKPGGETLPLFAKAREGARRIASDVYFHTQSGDYKAGSHRMILGYEFGVRLMDGGSAVGMLTASSMGAIALGRFHEIINNLDEAGLKRVADDLQRIEKLRVPASDIFTEEKIKSRYYFKLLWSENTISSGLPGVPPLQNGTIESSKRGIIPGPLRLNAIGFENSRYILPYILQDKRKTYKVQEAYFDRFIKETTGAYKTIDAEPSVYQKLTAFEPNVENNTFLIYCNNVARHNLMTTEIALRRYWLANKSYPASLEELTPKYLSKVPTDPLNDGKPLTYKQLDGGKDFLLYSYGANCKDDGGKDGNYRDPKDAADMVAGKWTR